MRYAGPDRVMRLALLNTRAHSIFRPWFYRFSWGQRWAAIHALEDECLGWMDTPRGRNTFAEFFTHYHLPALPELSAGLGRHRLSDRNHLG